MQVQTLSAAAGQALATPSVSPLLRGQLDFLAGQLGLSRDALAGALGRGASLDALARQQGVPADQLRAQVTARIAQGRAQQGESQIGEDQLSSLVARAFAQGGRPATEVRRGDPHAAYGAALVPLEEPQDTGRISILA